MRTRSGLAAVGSLGLTGTLVGVVGMVPPFPVVVRVDTPQEALYYANGGILQFVLRQLLANKPQPVPA